MKRLLILLFVCVSMKGWGAADYELIRDLVGTYRVLEWNGDPRVSGKLSIVADADGVGVSAVGLAMASRPVPTEKTVTAKEPTLLIRQGALLRQEFQANGNSVSIEYQIFDGYLEIRTQRCAPQLADCRLNSAIVTRGGAPGEQVDSTAFLHALGGKYDIQSAGGTKPKPDVSEGEVDVASDPIETAFYFPYCLPSGACDAGYIGFRYADTRIYRRVIAENHEVFHLIQGTGLTAFVYSWEREGNSITLRNLQYPMAGQEVSLEYVLQKRKEECVATTCALP